MFVAADLELKHIRKSFEGVVALDDAELECQRGEVHALLGENGAGKSTLVKILAGAVVPDAGSITLLNKPLTIRNPREARQRGIGMVYQEFSLIPDLSVAQNINFGHEPLSPAHTIRGGALREQTCNLLDELHLHEIDPDVTARDLPLAQRQQVEIAKVLSLNPQVVIFDEATSALSREQVEWLLALMKKLAGQNRIVLFISHRLSEVRQVADRITVFRGGKYVGMRTAQQASADELIAMMLGRKQGQLFPPRRPPVPRNVTLETNNVSYGRRLRGVNLQLNAGEILGVGGLVGQGQAELFLALFGMVQPEGEIKLGGKTVRINSPREALQHDIGLALVPEDRQTQGLILPMSVRENISLSILSAFANWGIVNRRRERDNVDTMARQLHILAKNLEQPVMRLSGGNQQKVVLGKLLLTKPKYLLLYDSTRGVDVGTKAEIFDLLRQLTEQGTSVLFYSTDLEELVNVCDRVLVMHDGKVAAELQADSLTEENVVRASVGEVVAANGTSHGSA